ncbi:MAG: DUF429 domain-containing protein [Cystobacter sp.]
MRFLGWDLSDPFARRPRAVDVALVDEGGRVVFEQWPWPAPDGEGRLDPEALVAAFPVDPSDVVVVDGPQALARPGARVREAERLLRAPGRTPDVLPLPGAPFSGFVRGAVLLFAALSRRGLPLLDLETPHLGDARLFEAFPGATWRQWGVEKLGRKTTPEGRAARRERLEAVGLRFPDAVLPSHDALDAALCAWLGWRTRSAPERLLAVGTPLWKDAEGWLREGRILDAAR